MSEIQSLTERVQRLSTAVDDANRWLLWSLVGAAIAAVLVGLATYVVISRSKRLADTQDLLSKAKDRQLASDLGSKDVEIGKAKDDAAKAGQKAGEANERAADATKRAEELRQQTVAMETTLEQERKLRTEMEKSEVRRALPYIVKDGKENIAPLRPFAGMNVIFEVYCQTRKPKERQVPSRLR